jgi:hypothetical protein
MDIFWYTVGVRRNILFSRNNSRYTLCTVTGPVLTSERDGLLHQGNNTAQSKIIWEKQPCYWSSHCMIDECAYVIWFFLSNSHLINKITLAEFVSVLYFVFNTLTFMLNMKLLWILSSSSIISITQTCVTQRCTVPLMHGQSERLHIYAMSLTGWIISNGIFFLAY